MKYKTVLERPDGEYVGFGPASGYASLENAKDGCQRQVEQRLGEDPERDPVELVNLIGNTWTSIAVTEVGRFHIEEVEESE